MDNKEKDWFEDWKIEKRIEHVKGGLIPVTQLVITLPHAKNGKTTFTLREFQALMQSDIDELLSILMSAFDQIQKDHGGYKK